MQHCDHANSKRKRAIRSVSLFTLCFCKYFFYNFFFCNFLIFGSLRFYYTLYCYYPSYIKEYMGVSADVIQLFCCCCFNSCRIGLLCASSLTVFTIIVCLCLYFFGVLIPKIFFLCFLVGMNLLIKWKKLSFLVQLGSFQEASPCEVAGKHLKLSNMRASE